MNEASETGASVPRLLERGEAAIATGRLDEAERAARELIAAVPGSEAGHALLSHACLLGRRFDEALDAATQGLASSPASEPLLRARAAALVDAGRPGEALAAADEALRVAPGDAGAHYLRSLALGRLRRLEEGRAAAALAVQLDPANPAHHTHLGDLWLGADAARAESHYRDALALDPERPWPLNNLGVALLRQGKRADAALAFRTALLVDPAFSQAKLNAFRTAVAVRRGGPWGIAAVGALWLVAVALVVDGFASGRVWELGGGFAVLVLQVAVAAALSRAGERRLAALDPALLALHARITADLDLVGRGAVGLGRGHRRP